MTHDHIANLIAQPDGTVRVEQFHPGGAGSFPFPTLSAAETYTFTILKADTIASIKGKPGILRATRTSRKHTYSITVEDTTFTRTTRRIYTHAVIYYKNFTGFIDKRSPCAPYVADVTYHGSRTLAEKAARKWPHIYCKTDIVTMNQ